MREFVGKPTYSGILDEDLYNCISVFNALRTMCEVNDAEKIKSVPVMFTGYVLNYYANNVKDCGASKEGFGNFA